MKKRTFVIGFIFLIIDQVTKIIVSSTIPENTDITIIKNFFSITNVYNTGAAFSILEGRTIFLSILSIIILIMLIKMSKDFIMNRRNIWAFGLLMGGIFGNFSDRLFLGMVRDFLNLKLFGYDFPVFNIADTCIVIGVFLLIISIFKGEDKSEDSSKHRKTDKTR